jgi:hypothetical protein
MPVLSNKSWTSNIYRYTKHNVTIIKTILHTFTALKRINISLRGKRIRDVTDNVRNHRANERIFYLLW